jgi:hypothetical protein
MVMSKKLYGFLLSILISLPPLMIIGSVQASPAFTESGQTGDSDVAVTLAQGDSEDYPGPDLLEGESFDTGENPDRPEVIGTDQYPTDGRPSDPDSEFQNTNTAVSSGGLAGKIYLWVAFAAALIIFTAAVLGAILLYTRQRYKE